MPKAKDKNNKKPPTLRLRRGTKVLFKNQPFRVLMKAGSDVMIQSLDDEDYTTVAQKSELKKYDKKAIKRNIKPVHALSEEELKEAKRREDILNAPGSIKDKIQKGKISRATYFNWNKLYEEGGRVLAALAPRRPARRRNRLTNELEVIIEKCINKHYLTTQKKSVRRVWEKVFNLCRKFKLRPPCEATVRDRINALNTKKKTSKREGHNVARDRHDLMSGKFPGAENPLDVAQVDHTRLDIRLVDSKRRRAIGRPYLTVMIDVCTRCILGYVLSFEAPSADTVGLCIYHAVMPKDEELKAMGIKGEWPAEGLIRKVHVDNAKEFHSNTFKKACAQHGINIDYRPVRTPHFGGHVERVIKTINDNIHSLPGTTFSNPTQRGNYNSAKKAALSLDDMNQWLTEWIVNVYHKEIHSGLDTSPIAEWKIKAQGLYEPSLPADPEKFRIDFMPCVYRKVVRQGIVWDRIWYSDTVLEKFIDRKDKTKNRKDKDREGKVLVHRDPNDISKLYLLDEDNGMYHEIPYAERGYPAVTLREWRAGKKVLKDRGRNDADVNEIFDAIERLGDIEKKAVETTNAAQKQLQNQENNYQAGKRRGKSKSSAKKKQESFKVVVDNTSPDDDDEDYEFNEEELDKGLVPWN